MSEADEISRLSARLQTDLLALNGRIAPVPRELQVRVALPVVAAGLLLVLALLAGRNRPFFKLGAFALFRFFRMLARPRRRQPGA